MAREVFKFHYKDTLNAGIDGCHNSNQRDEAISENVKKLIDNSLFLQGPLDAQVNSSGSLQVFLAAPLMLHQNRAVRKILDTSQLLILLSAFTITVMSTEVIRRRSSLIFASARSQDRRRAPGQRPANRYWLAESSKNSHKLADVRQGTRPTTSYPSGIQVGLHSRNRDLGYTHRAPFVFAEESLIEI